MDNTKINKNISREVEASMPTAGSRREFLTAIKTAGIGVVVSSSSVKLNSATPRTYRSGTYRSGETVTFGIMTDAHYAEKEVWNNRYYRDSLEKVTACIETFNAVKPDFVIDLGDLIDAAERDIEIGFLETINRALRKFEGDVHYVLGNHDLATFSKDEFLSMTGARGAYYSFDHVSRCINGGPFHFVVLDANYNRDGTPYCAGNFHWTETYINREQQAWLEEDLARAGEKSSFVFVHQNLHDETNPHGVKNAPEVRRILEHAGRVRCVFQGHDHSGGSAVINGIHYITLKGMVEGPGIENNKYALATARVSRCINGMNGFDLEGFGTQGGHEAVW